MGKSIVITGANRGLGLGMVKEILKTNNVSRLFATARNPATADELKAINDPRLVIIKMDVESEESVRDGARQIASTLGSAGLDILINNAGVLISVDYNKPINKKDAELNFNINCIAVMVVTQAFHDLLKAAAKRNGYAQVVNISSMLGSIALTHGSSHRNIVAYSMSKAALNMFSKNVSIDWKADNIRCTSIHPGWVQTDLGTQAAPLTVEESTSNMTKTIFKLGEANNGLFYDWKFEALPW